ncbi:amidohydrolase [Terrimonas rubra]|uniref:Amidohydrolase n=1 Tax=Terrimonas rubra TaxID=1035890 RepID=A0ABW6A3P2_9BACT
MIRKSILAALLVFTGAQVYAQPKWQAKVDAAAAALEQKVISWRRDFHEHPELGNQEKRTAGIVAAHLKSLGIDVQEGVAVTGVVGVLKGGKPGPVVALRADMDALPVTERGNLPFKSTVKASFNNQETGVMHACGHDAHVAILMGVAEILAGMRNEIAGTIKFIFQPAEEGISGLDTYGAKQMVEQGVLKNPDVAAIFGLHISSITPVGSLTYRPGPTMAAVDELKITVHGKQSHGARPWTSIDPVVTSAQIINGLQTIISRNIDITKNPAVVSIGAIHGGIRQNIIPEKVEMIGTIRTYNKDHQQLIHKRINEVAKNIAVSAGASADVDIDILYPVTNNDSALTQKMLPTLQRVAGNQFVSLVELQTGAEDFSFYQQKVPGLFFFLGAMPKEVSAAQAAPHHTPDFFIDESSFVLGVRSLTSLTLDYLQQPALKPAKR